MINIADEVEGTQIGVINIARKSSAPIGVLNLVADGIHHFGFFSSDAAPAGARLMLGGTYLYGAFTAGVTPFAPSQGLEFGDELNVSILGSIGGRVPLPVAELPLFVDVELGAGELSGPARTLFGSEGNGFGLHTFSRVMVGWRPLELLTISAGPALNVFIADRENFDPSTRPLSTSFGDPSGVLTTLSPGFALYIGL